MRVRAAAWEDARVILKGEVLELRNMDGRFGSPRGPASPAINNRPVPVYDHYGPGSSDNIGTSSDASRSKRNALQPAALRVTGSRLLVSEALDHKVIDRRADGFGVVSLIGWKIALGDQTIDLGGGATSTRTQRSFRLRRRRYKRMRPLAGWTASARTVLGPFPLTSNAGLSLWKDKTLL